MKNIKIKLEKIIAGICVCAIISSMIPMTSYAKVETNGTLTYEGVTMNNCKEVLINGNTKSGGKIKGFDVELKSFMDFLDANFKNKSSTSSLTSLAIARYREYRDSLRAQFKSIQVAGSREAEAKTNEGEFATGGVGEMYNFQNQVNAYALCEEIVNTYISLGRQEMIRHIKTSAAQKKTIMLLEKYKALNVKLRGLNMKIAEMFALFATFKNKFPGYSSKSCMKSLT